MPSLEQLRFDNSYAHLPAGFSVRVPPQPLEDARLVSVSPEALRLLEIDASEVQRPEFVEAFGGVRPLPGMEPVAAVYAGHQFGVYVPRLGDGRALLLGELQTSTGERWELNLKGSGLTPFSRRGDGRAVLRSTIREYLCSEAMHGLGIPTTRALCIIAGSEKVYREEVETGAMLIRLAPSHVRFGTFEYFHHTKQREHVATLADYVLARHFPHLEGTKDRHARFFAEVVERTAQLVAQWQAVGFAHGVLNTDNMSILGLTLDYGPFGFLDDFEPGFICNHSDDFGRYAFNKQPRIAVWNLARLAEALATLIPQEEAEAALQAFAPSFSTHFLARMREKLGLREARAGDLELLETLLARMTEARVDYTRFFRRLGRFDSSTEARNEPLRDLFLDTAAFDAWAAAYRTRLLSEGSEDAERCTRMERANPKYVLRNYLAQTAITRAQEGDFSEVERLRAVLSHPFDEQPEHEALAAPPPAWGKHLAVSCSS
ncbi:protein adenylyltransferase SelO [Hyalangium sp.]|uniref:protein adenylyltransferase SelO n=1 Tax=Hyalangium sp. TaxID=2028555 RepID=UPI002D34F859|nr:YdiU family protein [Hyalangium sp.]HYI00730.1 YdiU family protein [Hyalangium sp.]